MGNPLSNLIDKALRLRLHALSTVSLGCIPSQPMTIQNIKISIVRIACLKMFQLGIHSYKFVYMFQCIRLQLLSVINLAGSALPHHHCDYIHDYG